MSMSGGDEDTGENSLSLEKTVSEPASHKIWIFRSYPLKFLDHFERLFAFSFFAICGSMARLGLIALTNFENGGILWPNFTGCFVMAFSTTVFGSTLHLLHGTGFCGTLTSFSSFIVGLFHTCTEPKASWPTYGYGVPLLFGQLIIQIGVCCGGYQTGRHLGAFTTSILPLVFLRDPIFEVRYQRILALLGLLSWIAVIVLAIVLNNRDYPLAAVFSPLGLYVRYYLSRLNRGNAKWGTLAANMLGTALASMFDIFTTDAISTTQLQKQFLYAVSNGFCGCLSTVSTLIAELHALPLAKSYIYGFGTLAGGCSLAVIIMGSYYWTL